MQGGLDQGGPALQTIRNNMYTQTLRTLLRTANASNVPHAALVILASDVSDQASLGCLV